MRTLSTRWRDGGVEHELRLVPVPGTRGAPFPFGRGERTVPVEIADYHLLATPVTQELWAHVMGENPATHVAARHPVENVSFDHVTGPGGFLDRLNASPLRAAVAGPDDRLRFRLPSESEWEYAARGGPRWTDGFRFSGSDEPDEVAWYGPRFRAWRRVVCRVLGWPRGWRLMGRFPRLRRPTNTHEVATKKPNQLGLFDMSGNVWEWCEDVCVDEVDAVPRDGSPYRGPGAERRLRGGCHHNWDLHCTSTWRYGISPDAHDGCIGFRVALGPSR